MVEVGQETRLWQWVCLGKKKRERHIIGGGSLSRAEARADACTILTADKAS